MSCEVEAPIVQTFFLKIDLIFKNSVTFTAKLSRIPISLPPPVLLSHTTYPTITIPLLQTFGMWIHKLGLPW